MIVKKYKSVVEFVVDHGEGIFSVGFKSLDRPYKYLPGQFLHLSVDADYDGAGQWPESRCFSIQSNPGENLIRITYSVKGVYTKKMEKTLKVGREVWLKLPYGDLFQQSHRKDKTVFIAGGTGITPFLSLFTDESFSEYVNPKIYLGFRSEKHNIYLEENERIAKFHPVIHYENRNGMLDINRIFEENGSDTDYFISGPPAMIRAFKSVLMDKGVAASQVFTDDWE